MDYWRSESQGVLIKSRRCRFSKRCGTCTRAPMSDLARLPLSSSTIIAYRSTLVQSIMLRQMQRFTAEFSCLSDVYLHYQLQPPPLARLAQQKHANLPKPYVLFFLPFSILACLSGFCIFACSSSCLRCCTMSRGRVCASRVVWGTLPDVLCKSSELFGCSMLKYRFESQKSKISKLVFGLVRA